MASYIMHTKSLEILMDTMLLMVTIGISIMQIDIYTMSIQKMNKVFTNLVIFILVSSCLFRLVCI